MKITLSFLVMILVFMSLKFPFCSFKKNNLLVFHFLRFSKLSKIEIEKFPGVMGINHRKH